MFAYIAGSPPRLWLCAVEQRNHTLYLAAFLQWLPTQSMLSCALVREAQGLHPARLHAVFSSIDARSVYDWSIIQL